VQSDISSKGLRDVGEVRGESQRFKFLCQHIGITATQVRTCRPILSRHYASMMQDGLQISGPGGGEGWPPSHTHPSGGGGGGPPPTRIHTPTLT
jgi:hypothetical protein